MNFASVIAAALLVAVPLAFVLLWRREARAHRALVVRVEKVRVVLRKEHEADTGMLMSFIAGKFDAGVRLARTPEVSPRAPTSSPPPAASMGEVILPPPPPLPALTAEPDLGDEEAPTQVYLRLGAAPPARPEQAARRSR